MIKEIRRDLFEKITRVLASQGVQDTTIDMYIFEIDRFLSQLIQDCSNSSSSSSPPLPPPINSTNLSVQVTPPKTQNRTVIYHSLPNKPNPPIRKSIECLYMTPTMNKQSSLVTSHGQKLLNNDCRPKSASTILINHNRHSMSATSSSPYIPRFQRTRQKCFKRRTYSSDDDFISDIQQKVNFDAQMDTNSTQQSNIRVFTKHYEQKTSSLPGYSRVKSRTSNESNLTFPSTITTQKHNEEEQETSSSIQSNGIKKFVLNSLKLFVPSSPQQQKRIEK